ncbi:MAG: class I SAM-dependent methyltransferase [Pseudomonadota bacterium]|nr:class I SAM-dependent methyltransferase [Pseudomonadota bacterium]
MDRAVFDRMAELDQHHWWFTARRRILSSVIRRIVRPPAGARILELGCGTGHNLDTLGAFGRVEASELDDHARGLAAPRLGRTVEKIALPDLGKFPAASYDLIALLDVLEHVPDDKGSLAAILTRLKPGGALLLTVPANPWMWSAHDVAHHHHRRYRKAEIAALARAAGFEIALLSPFNTMLFPLIAGVRLINKVRGQDSADDALPARPVNKVLDTVFGAEAGLIGRLPFPFGVSLVAVLRRPAAAHRPV